MDNRDYYGFIEIDELDKNIISSQGSVKMIFLYNGKKYFYKAVHNVRGSYNELIAEELGHDFGIPMAHYDLATHMDNVGVISECFYNEDEKFIPLETIIKEIYNDHFIDEKNNLKDLWNIFYLKYGDKADELIKQVRNVFVFDILIGNIDRHCQNIGIVEDRNGNVRIAPLFDNELMLSDYSIYNGNYSLGLDRDDYYISSKNNSYNLVYKYLCISSEEEQNILINNLNIISKNNLDDVFDRIETRIGASINDIFKENVYYKMDSNRQMIAGQVNSSNKILKKV